ncbi:MAG TPA: energy transducer TonB [Rhodanobacteraceae bacterium]|nr:energy transducer TonB [Rhodanobacteraceae bacterium]
MFRLRTTATVSLLVLIGATGMSLWMSAWPRMQDRATEAAVAARHREFAKPQAPSRSRAHERQAAMRAKVESVHASPAPPTPVHAPSPAYPMEALRQGRGGTVTLRVSVDGSGNVTAVEVAHSSGDPALDDSARKSMRQWRFRAPVGGQPTTFDYPVTFRIGAATAR